MVVAFLEASARLLAQLSFVFIIAQLAMILCRQIGQPRVIGEMLGGVLIGASILGAFAPNFHQHLFPTHSLTLLEYIATTGLLLFMFDVGKSLKTNDLKDHLRGTAFISVVATIVPLCLGIAVGWYTFDSLAPAGVPLWVYSGFLGIAMSLTAFPVLARIVDERNLRGTRVGATAIASAAAEDVIAWIMLASLLSLYSSVKQDTNLAEAWSISALRIGTIAGYVLLMWKYVRPWMVQLGQTTQSSNILPWLSVAVFAGSCTISSLLKIHAVFGAFFAGACLAGIDSRSHSHHMQRWLRLAQKLLLPAFFGLTGLKTDISSLQTSSTLSLLALVLSAAIIGKLVIGTLAARWSGMNWRESWMLGSLLNTRGLMELVVLSIGLQAGIIEQTLFTTMVVMAVVTTMMTSPLLSWLGGQRISENSRLPSPVSAKIS